MKRKITALLLASVLVLSTAACGNKGESKEVPQRIVSLAASNTEILVGLGLSDNIVAADIYSSDAGISADVCTMDMQNPDIEALIAMKPDIIFVNEINTDGVSDPYVELKSAGAEVICIDSANSITDIKEDITTIAEYTDTAEKGKELVAEIDKAVEEVEAAVAGTEKKSVYFEISSAPYCYSFGSGTFLNEIIEISGGTNVFSGEEGWLSVTEENILAANPDVIITNVSYEGYDFNEIYLRSGWDSIDAVKNNEVFYVDSNASGRASQNITKAIFETARAIHPECFKE